MRYFDLLKTNPKIQEEFPPPGDWHSGNGYAVYGEPFKEDFFTGKKDKSIAKRFKEYRTRSKVGGLAIIYGAWVNTLSVQMNVLVEAAEEFYNNFYAAYPIFGHWMESVMAQAKKLNWVLDLFGRIRYLPKITLAPTPENKAVIGKQKRIAGNAPVQTSGSSMLKLALITQGNYIEKGHLNRFYGNAVVEYKYYTRIVGVSSALVTDEFKRLIETLEDGNVKVLITQDNKPVEEYSRPVRLSMKDIKQFGMYLIW